MRQLFRVILIVCLPVLSLAQSVKLDSGLVAFFPFNGNANDQSGHGLNGVVTGAALSPDRFANNNTAYYFDSVADRVSLPVGTIGMWSTVERSFSFWIKPTALHDLQDGCCTDGGLMSQYYHYNPSVSNFYFSIRKYGGVAKIRAVGDGVKVLDAPLAFDPVGKWTHVIVLMSYGENKSKIYVNGSLAATGTLSYNTNISPRSPVIGYIDGDANQNFLGSIDDLRIYDRVLNDAEIRTLFFEGTDFRIRLNTPVGGERLLANSTQKIQWATLTPISVSINYSTDNGASWNSIAPATLSGIGEYEWVVPNTLSTHCKVKIADISDTTAVDVSSSTFTITAGRLGDTWEALTSGVTNMLYSVHAVSDSVAWTSGTNGVILRTTDAGQSWTKSSVTGLVSNIRGIDRDKAFATSTESTTKIFKTIDGGVTWTTVFEQPGGFINTILMYTDQRGIALGDPVEAKWTILKTTNGGNTWFTMSTLDDWDWEVGYNNSASIVGSNVWFGSIAPKVYQSIDSGATWSSSSTPINPLYSVAFGSRMSGVAATNSGMTCYTTDGGATWKSSPSGGQGECNGLVAIDEKTYYLTSGAEIYKSTNGGATWKPNGLVPEYLRHISFSPSGRFALAVGDNGLIMKRKEQFQLPRLTLVQPSGGEHFAVGSVQRISWDASLVNTVKLEYSGDNGRTWQPVGYLPAKAFPAPKHGGKNVNMASAASPPAGFNWTIPSLESDSVKIRISDSSDASTWDINSNVFSIRAKFVRPTKQFAYDITTANGFYSLYGGEFDGSDFFISRWNAPDGRLYRFDRNGGFIESFAVAGMTSGFLDLAWDGRYLYGGSWTDILYQIDVGTYSIVQQIKMPPGTSIQSVAYDKKRDAFWISNWSTDIVCSDRKGRILSRIPAAKHRFSGMAGLAYDESSPGGPFLWVFDGGAEWEPKILYKIDTVGNRVDSISAMEGIPVDYPVAGGCFVTTGLIPGVVVVGGVLQGEPNVLFGWRAGTPTSVLVSNSIPREFVLYQNFPNPFNPSTVIRYQLPVSSNVSLKIYDLLGKEIATLVNEQQSAGWKEAQWNAPGIATGIYFYKLQAGSFVETKKMFIVK